MDETILLLGDSAVIAANLNNPFVIWLEVTGHARILRTGLSKRNSAYSVS